MDPELKKILDELRAQLGKNVDAIARLDAIEALAKQGQTDVAALRGEIELVRKTVTEREQIVRDLVQQGRVQAQQRDPSIVRGDSLALLGAIVRSELARANRMELPAAFRGEVELVRGFQEQCLARATVTPMSATGSYLVPTITEAAIRDALEEVSELLGLVDLMPGLPATGTFNMTFLATRPTMQPKRAGTDTAMSASDPVFAQLALSPQETYVFFPIDNKLFLMSAVALGGYFEGLCRQAMADRLAYWLLRADGSATYNSITGMLAEATADYVYSLPSGKTGFADLTDQDLNKAKAKVLKRGRGLKGRWIMDLEVQGVIENIDRTGKVPTITYAQDGTPRIKQNEVTIEEYMPGLDESAPATGFALYGDPATYVVAMVGGMQIASDSSVRFDKNQTAFRATTIVDIKRKPVKTLVVLKTAAQ
jgi:HK97 family phage major capsid protein